MGSVYCSDFKCSSYKAQVTSVVFKVYIFGSLHDLPQSGIIDLCQAGASESRAANLALEKFYNSNCTSSSTSSTWFDNDFGRIARECTGVRGISYATVYYTCLSSVVPMTVEPTALTLGTSTEWSTANIGARSFVTISGLVYCSDFGCSSYKAQVTNVVFMGSYSHSPGQDEIIDLCQTPSEARAANRALEEFYNSRCASSSNSTRFDYDFRRLARQCSDVPSIHYAGVFYTCRTNVGPTTAEPTAVMKSNGSGDDVFSASTQPRGDQRGANTVQVNAAEDAAFGALETLSVAAGVGAIIFTSTMILVYRKRRELICWRERSGTNETGRSLPPLPEEAPMVVIWPSDAVDGAYIDFRTYAEITVTEDIASPLPEEILRERAYAKLVTNQCDHIYETM